MNKQPEIWKSIPGPEDITRSQLSNGIVVLTRSNFHTHSVVISGYLGSGSMFDPDEKLGLALFTAQALMRGTKNYNHQELFGALESVGANLGFGASVHTASFTGRALAEDLPQLLRILSESLRHPVFPLDQVEKLRARYMTGLAIRAQSTEDQVALAFDEIIFSKHPYSRPEDGHMETIQGITRDDLVNFHETYYRPAGMVLVVVGAVSQEESIGLVEEAIGDWRNPLQVATLDFPALHRLDKTVRHHIPIPGKFQTDLAIGTLGPRRNSADYTPASLGNNVLGQFGMMGRIGEVVREQAGLAYHASTSLSSSIAAGSWEVSAGVNPVNLQRAIDLILKELKRFVSEPVSEEELADSQANFIGLLPLSLESNAGVASALIRLERFQLGLDYYQQFPKLVRNVTPEQVLETAQRYLHTDRIAIISSGPELEQESE
ncbi:MAG: insulinase family protein [Anaerolineaceae bacterium]|nr:insulinase family protein [Anaerolineaceae bacterium]